MRSEFHSAGLRAVDIYLRMGIIPAAPKNGRYLLNPARAERQQRSVSSSGCSEVPFFLHTGRRTAPAVLYRREEGSQKYRPVRRARSAQARAACCSGLRWRARAAGSAGRAAARGRALLRAAGQCPATGIATLSPGGRPSVTPLYFVTAGGRIWLGMSSWTLAARQVAADRRASVLFNVERDPADRRVLRISGPATLRTDLAPLPRPEHGARLGRLIEVLPEHTELLE